MPKKRDAQLDQEIRQALSRLSKKPDLKTREQLDAEIDAVLAAGLPAERFEVAHALGFRYPKKAPPKKMALTGTNLFALTQLVLKYGPEFPNRFDAVDAPHIKRTLALGLVEPAGTMLRLTATGRELVAGEIEENLARERRYIPQVNDLVRPALRGEVKERQDREHREKLMQLERGLEAVRLN
jgi:hypothetical protein